MIVSYKTTNILIHKHVWAESETKYAEAQYITTAVLRLPSPNTAFCLRSCIAWAGSFSYVRYLILESKNLTKPQLIFPQNLFLGTNIVILSHKPKFFLNFFLFSVAFTSFFVGSTFSYHSFIKDISTFQKANSYNKWFGSFFHYHNMLSSSIWTKDCMQTTPYSNYMPKHLPSRQHYYHPS